MTLPLVLRFETTRYFTARPEAVFDGLTDLAGAPAWMPGFVGMEPLTEGALAAGSRWRETRRASNRVSTEEFEVTHFDPPAALAVRVDGSKGTSGRGEFRFRYDLTPAAGGGTSVRLRGELEGLGLAGRLLGWLFVQQFRKICARDLDALALHLDRARQPDRPPAERGSDTPQGVREPARRTTQ